jgi:hypothetical protein
MKSYKAFAVTVLTASFSLLTIGYAAQNAQPATQPPAQASTQPTPVAAETAGQSKQFTNIQVMKDIPADQVVPSMQFIKAALGVDCVFCHVTDKGHAGFALDDKRNKKTAREMMIMTNAINQNPVADKRVTCATCHAGHNQPINTPPVLDEARWQERVDENARRTQFQQQQRTANNPSNATAGAAPAQPLSRAERDKAQQAAADAIFAKYTQAIGGEAPIAKLNTLQEKGVITTPHGDSTPFELREKAPDKIAYDRKPTTGDAMHLVSSGGQAAAALGPHTEAIHGFELEALKLDANFARNLNLRPQYTRVQAFPLTQKIDGQEVSVVRGTLANDQGQETLYFDLLSGLLVRRVTVLRTALGGIPQQTDYSDWHEVNGVKMPFTVKVSTPDNIQTRKVSEAKFNVPLDDKEFALPAETPAEPARNK